MAATTPYVLMSDLNLPVKVKINSVVGKDLHTQLEIASHTNYSQTTMAREAELFVTCQIFSDGKPLGVSCSTTYACFDDPNDMQWGEWLTFPLKYSDLSTSSSLVFTVWQIEMTQQKQKSMSENDTTPSTYSALPLAGSCMPMFNKHYLLKLGRRRLKMWPGGQGDGSLESTTPYRVKGETPRDLLIQIEKVMRQYRRKQLPKWLDKLTLRKIDKLRSGHSIESEELCLFIDFPPFQYPVVFHEKKCKGTLSLEDLSPIKDLDRLIILHDPEMEKDNPVERKYHKLAGSNKGLADRDLIPEMAERRRLDELISSPTKAVSQEDRRFVWKFRFTLTENKDALTKFLRCVDWDDPNDTAHALDLLKSWATIDSVDALELLGGFFRNQAVRTHAVITLSRADNAELYSYLLQLVQGLRYEAEYPSELSKFLFSRACGELELCNFFFWFMNVETYDTVKGTMYKEILEDFMGYLEAKKPEWRQMIIDQKQLVANLIRVSKYANEVRRVTAKVERMRESLGPTGQCKDVRTFNKAVRLPVRPDIKCVGIVPEKSTMFKSALAPLLVGFETEGSNEPIHRVIFKCGDDLRQDQLMIQMINLMDSLLKKVNLDLKLTPYRVLAVSPEHGFVEFVQRSHALAAVLDNNERDISKFFMHHTQGKHKKLQQVLDTFVKSTAGYCVITYILGIGDRHLDNLLLTEEGKLFHIDFGWIFGKDPKPLPPAMRFCREMVEAMGGAGSMKYMEFRSHCCLAFNILRKHSKLIINLLSLMGDANIPHLIDNVEKNLLKVQEKFRLDLNDEDASTYLLQLVDDSVSALFPQMLEKLHKYSTMLR